MMKKYLMMGASALVMGAMFTACSNDEGVTAEEYYQALYNQAFEKAFGKVSPNQDWGFGPEGSTRATRAITVNGDTYDAFPFPSAEELNAAFPTAIPDNADEVSELEALYKGKPIPGVEGREFYDLNWIYQYQITKGYNLKITQAGEVELGGGHKNIVGDEVQYYNVYVKVNGDVTIKRNGASHFNLYILEGNVTLDSNYGEQSGIISVASGATLNDPRYSIAANEGVKLYNRGTINATNSQKYDIGNFCTVYNQGKFDVTGALTYSPADANHSYFVNFSDQAELTAASMTLNSTGNFFNDGKVTISGETNVTQQNIYWVNNGHYTTGSMAFSAKNNTFYNYCQLIVVNNCSFRDGAFNLMQNSYTECGTGLFNNFRVNMFDNSGINIKNGTKWGQQGADFMGAYQMQGFVAADDNAKVFVRLGGENFVPAHKGSAFHVSGANLTLAYENMKFYDGFYFGTDWNGTSYWNETTAEILANNKDERTTWDLHNVTKVFTGDDFSKVTVTPNTNSCGATWSTGTVPPPVGPTKKSIRIMAEDLSASEASDFDFNDVVFDVEWTFAEGATSTNKVKVTLWAAGGTLPLKINSVGGAGGFEVHNALGVSEIKTMINTHAKDRAGTYKEKDANGVVQEVTYYWLDDAKDNNPYEETITLANGASISKDDFETDVNTNLRVEVEKNGQWYLLTAERGTPACKFGCPVGTPWAMERHNMNNAFTSFKSWVNNSSPTDWYNSKVTEQVYNAGKSVICAHGQH